MSELPVLKDRPVHEVPRPKPFQFRLWHLLVAMALVSAVLAVFVPIIRWRTRQMHARNNLRNIVIGLHNYHDVFGTFPPAYVNDASGRPAHSWRVVIHPFVDDDRLKLPYDFAEPWDGPKNKLLAQRTPAAYKLWHDGSTADGMTNYVAIVGPDAAWAGERPINLAHITDGTSNTILVVEISNSNIPWSSPQDLPSEELEAWLDPKNQPHLGLDIAGGFVAFADGSVHYLPRDMAIEKLRKLITPAGNERVSLEE
jgi:hypothetical protein